MKLSRTSVKSNDVRLPQPVAGEALVVERYRSGRVKAVILHPDDFDQLQRSSVVLDEVSSLPGSELTDLAARLHRAAELPEAGLLDDESSVRRILGV